MLNVRMDSERDVQSCQLSVLESFNMRNVRMNSERYVGNQLLRISKILVVLAQRDRFRKFSGMPSINCVEKRRIKILFQYAKCGNKQ